MAFTRDFKNHAVNFRKPALSLNDEGVPKETHIGIMEFIEQINKSDSVIGIERAKELRRKSFYNVLDLFEKYGSKSYDKFWNIQIEEIAELKLNEFANIPFLRPFCDYIECFAENKTSISEQLYASISFGISKKIIEEYFKRLEESKNTGKEFIPPKLRRVGARPNRDFVLYGSYEVKFPNSKKIAIEKNEIFRRFEDWCYIQGVSNREGVLMAMEQIVNNNKVEGIKPLEEYKIETELDKLYFAKKETTKDKLIKYTILLEKNVYNKAQEIIKFYNADPLNKKKKINLSDYVNNAIYAYNKTVNLKYSDNEKYNAIKEIKGGDK